MRIFQVANYIPGYHQTSGGAEQACYNLVKYLKKKGEDVTLFTTHLNKPSKEIFPIKELPTIRDVVGKTIDKYLEIFKWYLMQFDIVAFFYFFTALKKFKPRIVHFHNIHVPTLSLIWLAKLMGSKTYLSVYDYWYFCPNVTLLDYNEKICRRFHGTYCVKCLPNSFRLIQKFLLLFRKKVFDFFLKCVDFYFVLSKSSANILQDYGIPEQKIHIVHLTLFDKDNAPPPGRTEKNLLVFAGWFQPRKGLHILLDAMPEVLKEFPSAKLYVFTNEPKWGGMEYKQKIYSMVEEKGLKDNIVFSGKRPHNEVESFLSRAQVVIIPEQWENMSPVVLSEAMAFARPTVASNIGGIPEFIHDGINGFLAEYNNPGEFAEKIICIMKDEKMAEEMGNRARNDALELFDKENCLNKIIQVYYNR